MRTALKGMSHIFECIGKFGYFIASYFTRISIKLADKKIAQLNKEIDNKLKKMIGMEDRP